MSQPPARYQGLRQHTGDPLAPLELFGELLVMPADPFAGAVVGVPTHIRAEPARRRRAAECLGHRADVMGCAAATDAEVVDSERSRRRRERAHLVAVG